MYTRVCVLICGFYEIRSAEQCITIILMQSSKYICICHIITHVHVCYAGRLIDNTHEHVRMYIIFQVIIQLELRTCVHKFYPFFDFLLLGFSSLLQSSFFLSFPHSEPSSQQSLNYIHNFNLKRRIYTCTCTCTS